MDNKTKCDCHERIGVPINSYALFMELKDFFSTRTTEGIFQEIPVTKPYFDYPGHGGKGTYKHYADKWYHCKLCGTLWEMQYPDFPAKGFVKKFPDGRYFKRGVRE